MKHILAIAHSAGGFGVSSLLQNSPRAMQLLRGVAFTDSFYDVSNKLSKEHLMQFYSVAVHWVCSDTQLNEPVGNQRIEDDNKEENLEVVKQQCVTISAGTQQHEMSTGMAQYSIYEYFDAKMEEIGYKLDDPSLKEEGRQKQKDNNKPAWLQRVLRRQQRFAQWIQENVKETKQ
ncbi:MAG: hypothetical protein EZS28_035756 [Streblomastix strix]|uniref:Uncharacterized protein n=1 Tax=Streblomastix strix TaxID=222440 RepID=A0A5J4UDT1_9EUKA|nr:MAG: hypothetical protein EZS28_035756 [Streblomastix strix]